MSDIKKYLEILRDILVGFEQGYHIAPSKKRIDACKMIIKALEQEPCDKQRYVVKGINNDKIEFVDKYSVRAFNRYVKFIKNVAQTERKALEQEPRKDGVILTHKEYNELISNEYNAGYRKGYDNGYCKGYAVASEEQEPVFDKIRTEIEQLPTNTRINWNGCCPDIDYPEIEFVDVSKAGLLEIIDKYKVETEE